MREITSHRVNPANDTIAIIVTDKPGAGGAHHRYELRGFETERNPGYADDGDAELVVLFQNGPIAEAGVNGVTQEALLAIVADRLQSFQVGPYACTENAEALKHVEAAQEALLSRTRARMARGVEGTHKV